MRTPDCVLDGEVCALDEQGRASFSAMQQGAAGTPLVLYVFDVLEVEGEPLVDLPLTERRERLDELLDPRNRDVRLSDAFEDGEALLEAAKRQGLEGVIAKRGDSRYQPGRRSRDWLKVKTHGRQEFVVAGYTRGKGTREHGLRLARARASTTTRGTCATSATSAPGSTRRRSTGCSRLLRPLETSECPFPEPPKMPRVRKGDVVWVEPRLVAEVEFAEWTHDGHLRAPSYQGLREDKQAAEVRREDANAEQPAAVSSPIEPEFRCGRRTLKLSNLDKPFWPDEGITKGDLLAYYRDVAAVVPHLRDRPFTMRRYPDGAYGKAFFQKDAPTHMPDWIPTKRVLGLDARVAAEEEVDLGAARERRARAAVDGEHGLHRPEHVVLARRQARAGPTGCSSTSTPRPTWASRRRSRSRCS